ncbi:MAG: hypothetical protein OXC44_01575 [Proteobacteria bacterium]|nr:hypothetical protein [Pseudomonadota bacterium]
MNVKNNCKVTVLTPPPFSKYLNKFFVALIAFNLLLVGCNNQDNAPVTRSVSSVASAEAQEDIDFAGLDKEIDQEMSAELKKANAAASANIDKSSIEKYSFLPFIGIGRIGGVAFAGRLGPKRSSNEQQKTCIMYNNHDPVTLGAFNNFPESNASQYVHYPQGIFYFHNYDDYSHCKVLYDSVAIYVRYKKSDGTFEHALVNDERKNGYPVFDFELSQVGYNGKRWPRNGDKIYGHRLDSRNTLLFWDNSFLLGGRLDAVLESLRNLGISEMWLEFKLYKPPYPSSKGISLIFSREETRVFSQLAGYKAFNGLVPKFGVSGSNVVVDKKVYPDDHEQRPGVIYNKISSGDTASMEVMRSFVSRFVEALNSEKTNHDHLK